MGLFGKAWNSIMTNSNNQVEEQELAQIRRDWDSMRNDALTPKERDEIDAIFSRYL